MTSQALFRSAFGTDPAGVFSAPGRVNLIGEHTDYNGGLVLPFAIDARATVSVAVSATDRIRVVSAQRPGGVLSFRTSELVPGSAAARGWPAYPLGVIWSLAQAGPAVSGLDIALDSAVPAGAGLSSSAAVECAVALAVSTMQGLTLAPEALARIAQRAENDFVGVPCGLMDQMAATACRAGHLLFFDVGAGTTEQIPFDPAGADLAVLVIDTRTHHALADGEYAARRADCERAAAVLGVDTLREISDAGLDDALGRLVDPVLRRRVRHVVTENARVRAAVELLRDGRVADIGPLLTASHRSLREDFEVSTAELDVAAQAAIDCGALGARMIGGGFGGSVIALVPGELIDRIGRAVRGSFADSGFGEPVLLTVSPADGARRDR